MFSAFTNSLKIPELRSRILYTLSLLFIARVGAHIPLPGLDPKPLQQPNPPIWIGGGGEQLTLRVVAQHADRSNFGGKPDEWQHKADVLRGHCQTIGRDVEKPSSCSTSGLSGAELATTSAPPSSPSGTMPCSMAWSFDTSARTSSATGGSSPNGAGRRPYDSARSAVSRDSDTFATSSRFVARSPP